MPPTRLKKQKLEPLYSVDKAAELIGLRPGTVRNMISDGRIAAVRIAGTRSVRIAHSEIERHRRA